MSQIKSRTRKNYEMTCLRQMELQTSSKWSRWLRWSIPIPVISLLRDGQGGFALNRSKFGKLTFVYCFPGLSFGRIRSTTSITRHKTMVRWKNIHRALDYVVYIQAQILSMVNINNNSELYLNLVAVQHVNVHVLQRIEYFGHFFLRKDSPSFIWHVVPN